MRPCDLNTVILFPAVKYFFSKGEVWIFLYISNDPVGLKTRCDAYMLLWGVFSARPIKMVMFKSLAWNENKSVISLFMDLQMERIPGPVV